MRTTITLSRRCSSDFCSDRKNKAELTSDACVASSQGARAVRTLVVLPEAYAECGSAERPLRYPSPVRSRVWLRHFARPAAVDRPNTTCSRPPCRSDLPGRNSPQRLPARGILCSGRRLTQAVRPYGNVVVPSVFRVQLVFEAMYSSWERCQCPGDGGWLLAAMVRRTI